MAHVVVVAIATAEGGSVEGIQLHCSARNIFRTSELREEIASKLQRAPEDIRLVSHAEEGPVELHDTYEGSDLPSGAKLELLTMGMLEVTINQGAAAQG